MVPNLNTIPEARWSCFLSQKDITLTYHIQHLNQVDRKKYFNWVSFHELQQSFAQFWRKTNLYSVTLWWILSGSSHLRRHMFCRSFIGHNLWKNRGGVSHKKLQPSSFWSGWPQDQELGCGVPEGEGGVWDIGVALSDQEGAISSPGLCTVILDQTLSHQPAVLHATVKPGLWAVQVLLLRKDETNTGFNTCTYSFTFTYSQ